MNHRKRDRRICVEDGREERRKKTSKNEFCFSGGIEENEGRQRSAFYAIDSVVVLRGKMEMVRRF